MNTESDSELRPEDYSRLPFAIFAVANTSIITAITYKLTKSWSTTGEVWAVVGTGWMALLWLCRYHVDLLARRLR
jgi:hypothetical protein